MRSSSAAVRLATLGALAWTSSACFVVGGGMVVEDQGGMVVETLEAVEVEPLEPLPPPVPPGPPGDEADAEAELVTPTPGMADVRPVPWDRARVDGTTVTVWWWSGVAPCTVLDRVEVEETDEVVTLTLFEGSEPANGDVACIDIAQRKATTVELEAPVGKRSLVDGAETSS